MAIITDDAIREAWGQALGIDTSGASTEKLARMRAMLESADGYGMSVERIRDRLGGWDAVWRSVLAELGFAFAYFDEWETDPDDLLYGIAIVTQPEDGEGEWALKIGRRRYVQLTGPGDLRRRVRRLREALEPGTKETDHA